MTICTQPSRMPPTPTAPSGSLRLWKPLASACNAAPPRGRISRNGAISTSSRFSRSFSADFLLDYAELCAGRARRVWVEACHIRTTCAISLMTSRHRTVDDRPFGGGEGIVMKVEPAVRAAVESLVFSGYEGGNTVAAQCLPGTAIVLLSASICWKTLSGRRRRAALQKLFKHASCCCAGAMKGIDERVAEHLATDEISIGDFCALRRRTARQYDRGIGTRRD